MRDRTFVLEIVFVTPELRAPDPGDFFSKNPEFWGTFLHNIWEKLMHHRQFFQGGYRTKMKIRSDENENQVGNFSRASSAQKKGFPNFSPAVGFFRRGGTENR